MIYIAIIAVSICAVAISLAIYAFRDSNKILKKAEKECDVVDWGEV